MNNKIKKQAINPVEIKAFKKLVWDFYANNKRDFPWRSDISIYTIVVSEIMLQQTQANRVVDKFRAFIEHFPDFEALAKASNVDVLRLWKGLGYNRRALALKKIAEQFAGRESSFPKIPEEIDLLPSIGPATAASIAVFAYNEPHVFIETNVRRVFIHHFFSKKRGVVSDAVLMPVIEAALDKKRPREWYYALMDYGSALVKLVPNPNRKSKHYTKQSKFEGSNRQIRGIILDLALKSKNKQISISDICGHLQGRGIFAKGASEIEKRLNDALVALKNEGFLEIRGKIVHIKE